MPDNQNGFSSLVKDLYKQAGVGYNPTDEDIKSIQDRYKDDYRTFMSDFYKQSKIKHELTDDDFKSIGEHYQLGKTQVPINDNEDQVDVSIEKPKHPIPAEDMQNSPWDATTSATNQNYQRWKEEDEAKFMNFWNNDPDVLAWKKEMIAEGENPDKQRDDTTYFDYRKAWKAGDKPLPNKNDNNKRHWGSTGKTEEHPTAWKQKYIELTGNDPDEKNITFDKALKEYPQLSKYQTNGILQENVVSSPGQDQTSVNIPSEKDKTGFFNNTGFGRGLWVGGKQFLSGTAKGIVETPMISEKLSNVFAPGLPKAMAYLRSKVWGEDIGEAEKDVKNFLKDKSADITQWGQSNLPEMKGGAGEFIGELIPQTALYATAIMLRNPAIANVGLGMVGASSVGQGLEAYDQYKKESGQPIDENERAGTAVAYALAEYIPERLALKSLIPKPIRTKLIGKFLSANVENTARTGKQIIEELIKKEPGATKALLNSFAKASTIEAAQEAATELGQMAADRFLVGRELAKGEFAQRLGMSALGGAAMGGMLAPFSTFSQRASDKSRRNRLGQVTVATDENGKSWELIRDEKGNTLGISPDGKTNDKLGEDIWQNAITVSTEEFNKLTDELRRAGNISDEIWRESRHNDIRKQAGSYMQAYKNENTGNLEIWYDNEDINEETGKPKQYFVIGETDDGMTVMIDKDGVRKIESKDRIRPTMEVYSEEDVANELIKRYDEQNPPEKNIITDQPETIIWNGKNYSVQDVMPDGTWIISEVDENGTAFGKVEHLSPEEQQLLNKEIQKDPTVTPEIRIKEINGQAYKLNPTEDGGYSVDGIKSEKDALKAQKDFQSAYPEIGVQIIKTKENPDDYLSDYNYSVKVSPTPQKTTQFKKAFGKQELDFNQNEDGTIEFIPSEKLTNEQALKLLQKEYEKSEKWEVVPETEQVVTPAATPLDEDETTEIIKKIVLRPKTKVTTQEETSKVSEKESEVTPETKDIEKQKAELEQKRQEELTEATQNIQDRINLLEKAKGIGSTIEEVGDFYLNKKDNWTDEDNRIYDFINTISKTKEEDQLPIQEHIDYWENELDKTKSNRSDKNKAGRINKKYDDELAKLETKPETEQEKLPETVNISEEKNKKLTEKKSELPEYQKETVSKNEKSYQKEKPSENEGEQKSVTSWRNEFEKAKESNNKKTIQSLYDKVNIVLNGIAQKSGDNVVKEFETLKTDIENYSNKLKESEAKNDKENINRLPSSEQEGKTTKQTGLVEKPSGEQVDTGGNVQSDEKSGEEALKQAESEVNTNPSDAQKEAGNYKKGHVNISGFDITIENPKGSKRSGKDEAGKKWSRTMNNSYGYFKRTKGKDGDQIDVFIGENLNSDKVFVVDQYNKDNSFDEHKVMVGFDDITQAREAYLSNYEKGWTGLGAITPVKLEDFKTWVGEGTRRTKPFSEYAKIQKKIQSKSKPRKKAKLSATIQKALDINVFTPREIAMQHFMRGNKINMSAIQYIFGGKQNRNVKSIDGERKARISYYSPNGQGVDEIAQYLWENNENITPGAESTDYRDAVIDVIQSFNSPTAMSNDLLQAYNRANEEEIRQAELQEMEEKQRMLEQDAIENEILDALEKNGLIPSESQLNELFLPYESEQGEEPLNAEKVPEEEVKGNRETGGGNQQESVTKSQETELKSLQSKLKAAEQAYNTAKNKHQKLSDRLKNSPEFGNKGQADIFGGVAGNDLLDFGDELIMARKAVSEAKKDMDRAGDEVQKINKQIENLKGKIGQKDIFEEGKPIFQPQKPKASLTEFYKERPNIQKDIIQKLKDLGYVSDFMLENGYDNTEDISKAEYIRIIAHQEGDEYDWIHKNIKLPKQKIVDVNYVLDKLDTDKVFKNFSEDFQKILNGTDFENSINIYSTTYGIGVESIFGNKKSREFVEGKLNDLGIDYTTEYSDARWVFRYKISKSKENIEKLKNINKPTIKEQTPTPSSLLDIAEKKAEKQVKPEERKGDDGILFSKGKITESENFKRWSRNAPVLSENEIANAEPNKSQVFAVFHGTTHSFYEFDPDVKGNSEGHFGKVNYFTSDEYDAQKNYAGEGPDLTNRIEQRKESIQWEIGNALEDGTNYKNVADEWNIPVEDIQGMDEEEIAEYIAKKELSGGDEKILELFVRLDNPVIINGKNKTWIEPFDEDTVESYREQAKSEILEENDATEEDVDQYEDEIQERFNELMQYEENQIAAAAQQAAWDNGIDPDIVLSALPEEYYYESITADALNKSLRSNEELAFAEGENGELISSQIIADVFKNLGFDGIVLVGAKEFFSNMEMDPNASHVHIFSNERGKIKLSDGTNIEFNENTNDIRFSKTSQLGFYSPTERALERITQTKGTPEQFKAMLLKNGAKEAEMEWMGWDEFASGKKSLTVEEIQDWIDQNKIEVEEVTKGVTNNEIYTDEWYDIRSNLMDKGFYLEVDDEFNLFVTSPDGDTFASKSEASNSKEIDVKDNIESINKAFDIIKKGTSSDVKYSQYQLPGGKNYKEVLLTMPEKREPLGWRVVTKYANKVVKTDVPFKTKQEAEEHLQFIKDATGRDTEVYLEEDTKTTGKSKDNFRSSHWEEPNILAHIRFNERTDSEGNKVLFIEEIQSDWSQAIRKEGVTTKWKPEQLTFLKGENAKQYADPNSFWVVEAKNEQGQNEQVFTILKSHHKTEKDVIDYIVNQKPRTSGKPNMPFKQTPQWVNLALRRMIRYAAENNFDKIAWTNGEMQAERYDLSKQISEVYYNPETEVLAADDLSGNRVLDQDGVLPDKIEDYVGKEVAKKLLADNVEKTSTGWNVLRGQDLKVGGEGMKAFYDNIVPNLAGKLGKKFGAKVESTPLIKTDGKEVVKKFRGENAVEEGNRFYESIKNNDNYRGVGIVSRPEMATVHWRDTELIPVNSLPITPQMYEAAFSEGLPLFQRGLVETATSESKPEIVSKLNEIQSRTKNPSSLYIGSNLNDIIAEMENRGASKAKIDKIKEQGKKAPGFYDIGDDRVYINMQHITSSDEAIATWVHENWHKGIRNLVEDPSELDKLNEKIYDTFLSLGKTDARIRDIIIHVNNNYKGETKATKGNEMAARLAEKIISKEELNPVEQSLWGKITKWFKDLLRKTFRFNPDVFTEEQLAKLIRSAVQSNFQTEAERTKTGSENVEFVEQKKVSTIPQTETEAFKKWFGNSKVVDKNGKPLVVYHGTTKDFNVFDEKKLGKNTKAPLGKFGFFFTPDFDLAMDFTRKDWTNKNSKFKSDYPYAHKVYLKLENPKHISVRHFTTIGEDNIIPYKNTLKENGFDGIIVDKWDAETKESWIRLFGEKGTKEFDENQYIVFSPTQIKSATGNQGTFDPNNPSILFQKEATKPNEKQLKTRSEKLRELLQDRELALKRWQEMITKELGVEIRDFENPYQKENLYHGRVLTKMDNFTDNQADKLIKATSKLAKAGKMEIQDVSHYMVAKHGPERNRYFWSLNEKNIGKDFSGLTELQKIVAAKETDPAKAMIIESMPINEFGDYYTKEIETKVGKKNIDDFWKAVNNATEFSLKELKDSGLISKETYDNLKSRYGNYVPLRGWEQTDNFDYSTVVGEFSSPIKKAEGRKSLSDDPLSYILNMANSVILAAERNRVKQAAGNLVRNNRTKLKDLVTFKPVYFVKTGQMDANGKEIVYETIDRPEQSLWDDDKVSMKIPSEYKQRKPSSAAKEFEVEFYENGQRLVLVFEGSDPAVARAINNREINTRIDMANKAISNSIGRGTRYLSAVLTSMNPGFVLPNMMRDIPLAILSEYVHGNYKDAVSMLPNLKDAEGAVRRALAGKADMKNPLDVKYDRFLKNGGATGFVHLRSVEDFKKAIKRDISHINMEKDAGIMMGNAFRTGLKYIENLSEWSENITRFAVYLNHINKGETAEKAAYEAKNSTVNFNKKGRLTPTLNGLFAFFNAGVQAGDKYFKMWGKNWKKMAGIHSFLMIQGFLNAMLFDLFGGEDDEGLRQYDKVSDYIKFNYMVIPVPGTDRVVTIPMPHVLRAFHGIGIQAYNLMTNRKKPFQAITETMANIPQDVLPIDGSGFLDKDGNITAKPFTPTFIRPYVEWRMNENFMGQSIIPEPYTAEQERMQADAIRYRKDVSGWAKAFTDKLYSIGVKAAGGDEEDVKLGNDMVLNNGEITEIPEIFDISPETIEHFYESYTGGTGKFFNDIFKTASNVLKTGDKLLDGEDFKEAVKEINLNSIPVANRFVRQPWGDPLKNEYFKVRRNLEDKLTIMKQYKKNQQWDKYIDTQLEIGIDLNFYKLYEDNVGSLDDYYNSLLNLGEKEMAKEIDKEKRNAMKKVIELEK